MGGIRLVVSDITISFMWVWSGALIKIFVNEILEMGLETGGEVVKGALSVINMFLFAYLSKLSRGGAYNPLTLLPSAVSGDFPRFLFTVGARIPAQVCFAPASFSI